MRLVLSGRALTMDPTKPEAEALGIREGRIVAVGTEAACLREVPGATVREVPFLLPAFSDAHTHLVDHGVRLLRVRLDRAKSREELLATVRERAKMTPEDGWIVGYAWDESKWSDRTMPTRQDIESVTTRHPVALMRVDMHMAAANGEAMKRAGVWAEDGLLREEAAYAVHDAATPSRGTVEKGIERAVRESHALGIASCCAVVDSTQLDVLRDAQSRGALGVRVAALLRDPDAFAEGVAPDEDENVRILGAKLFTDGSIGSRTAALSEGYAGAHDHRGDLVYDAPTLRARVAAALSRGLQPALHAIGDLGVEATLDAFRAAGVTPRHRARIEHAEMVTDEQLDEMRRLGVVASVQPNFTGEWGMPGQMYEERLGRERALLLNRLRIYADAGVPLAFGSDHMPYGPLRGIHDAVNGPTAAHRLSVEEALAAYTAGSAFASFEEHRRGRLAPGMLADVVALDRDPREDPSQILERAVVVTVVRGRIVHEA